MIRLDIVIPFLFACVCAAWACALEINECPPVDQVWMAFVFAAFAVWRACK
jgi:hypothetical protein